MTQEDEAPIIIYEDADRAVEVRLDIDEETVWLSLGQIADVFGRDKSVISRHLKNVFERHELERDSVVAKKATTAADGKTYRVEYFNLDAIISIGYRVNSSRATRFRQWATRILREHLTRGWTLNRQRFETNARELEAALELVRRTARSPELGLEAGRGLVDIVTRYAQTFLLLQRYDEGLLTEPKAETGGTLPTIGEARDALAALKEDLMAKGQATELFAQERGEGLDSVLGNLEQSVFGEPAYPTVESKAAHLLYFVIKNHPFSDGNKRSAAYVFVDFLHRNHRLISTTGEPVINDVGLAALTLLIAESDPANKETMIRLIMNMLANETNTA
ncbi:virulence protein RhuM/Fic/DOC family protein [Thioalkalivibrio sp. ALMg11]|uniref:virulence protein RhuM/Fic/DOC family protein n=1 Tax=Thioalkalivibrio sp. ALMg11 TaxID=1158165 RepID=UPI00036F7564|nr:virulence protein RhuM/Fic/DOC family protein [Thioalkalivibrio sp. ALMg11]